MREYRVLGDARVKEEFTQEHCRRLAQWFGRDGRFVHYGTAPSSRERLWNCMSLLAQGGRAERRLAQAIILGTPIDHNHFTPFAAVEILLRFPETLSAEARTHLLRLAREHLANAMEFRFGSSGTHNFSCMGTWFLLAASQLLDSYEWTHPLGSIPAVYSRGRIRALGLNSLRLLAYEADRQDVFTEWNSPTYSPISLHCLAKIVELIPIPEAQTLALQLELKLWRELLSLYHPGLGLSCGPYSRAYRCDVLGQNSQLRILLCYLRLSKDRSLVELFDEAQPGLIFHHDGDVPFTWSGPAWQLAGRYHVPVEVLQELRHRRYPHRTEATVRWESFGAVDPKTGKYLPVQGDLQPGGEARVVQVQRADSALGYRSRAVHGHSFPIHFHYALTRRVRTMRDVRNVVAGVFFHHPPQEWVPDQRGQPMEASNFNNEGQVEVEECRGGLRFRARPFPGLARLPSGELSINSFIPLHFAPVTQAWLNGREFAGAPLSCRGRRGELRVRDRGVAYIIRYAFARAVEIRLWRWANFLRFAGIWYQAEPRLFTEAELAELTVTGRFTVRADSPKGQA